MDAAVVSDPLAASTVLGLLWLFSSGLVLRQFPFYSHGTFLYSLLHSSIQQFLLSDDGNGVLLVYLSTFAPEEK